jgi:hypothetical protein
MCGSPFVGRHGSHRCGREVLGAAVVQRGGAVLMSRTGCVREVSLFEASLDPTLHTVTMVPRKTGASVSANVCFYP